MTTKLDNDTNCKKPADLKAEKDSSKDANSNDASPAKQTSEDPNNSKVKSTSNDTRSTPLDSLSDELEEHYKDLQHYSNQNNDHHPVPSLPPAAHHAPPQDSSELLSPWWSEETPDTATQPETDAPNQQQQQQQQQQEQPRQPQHPQQQQPQQPEQPPSQSSPDNEYIRYILRYGRSATDRQGTEVWEEKCVIWTKDPTKVEKAIESAIGGPDKTTTTSTTTPAKASSPPDLSPCSMICLFRESQERKRLKREQLSSWNPFYGNWLVVTHTQAALAEHMKETDIVRKDSPQYYSIELGERFGRLDQDVAMFMKKTFSPVQELGRRYMNSWKDGTQADFFTRFMASAQRGDGLFLLRDSLRRMMESMTGSDDKKNGGDDHK